MFSHQRASKSNYTYEKTENKSLTRWKCCTALVKRRTRHSCHLMIDMFVLPLRSNQWWIWHLKDQGAPSDNILERLLNVMETQPSQCKLCLLKALISEKASVVYNRGKGRMTLIDSALIRKCFVFLVWESLQYCKLVMQTHLLIPVKHFAALNFKSYWL